MSFMLNLYIFILIATFLECSLGFSEINKVDILWNDWPKISKHHEGPSGELYLRVVFSVSSDRTNLWSLLLKNCNQTMDLIDWSCSHPDNVRDIVLAFGIEAGWKYFLKVRSLG